MEILASVDHNWFDHLDDCLKMPTKKYQRLTQFLEKNKIGFLPISIQKFLQFDNNNCITKQAPNLLKTNNPCLLRYGVENSENQSFIACIADLYGTLILNNSKSISISEMKNIINSARRDYSRYVT